MRISFIGLGNMGGGMARNLLAHCKTRAHVFTAFDIRAGACGALAADGARVADSAARAAADADVLFTSLPGAAQIHAVADEVLRALPAHAVWFETSTNDPGEWKKICAMARSVTLVDAPVTGGAEGAAAGTLTMLLGGDERAPELHRELLQSMANKIVHMGPHGAGYVAKLCQLHLNYLAAQGIGEALMLAAKSGLNLQTLHEVFRESCAQSYVAERYIPKVLDGGYDDSFTLGLAEKDMRLISALGKQLGVELALGDSVHARYQTACKTYGDDAPHLSNIRLLEEQAKKLLRA